MSDFIMKMMAVLSRCVRFIASTAKGIVRSIKFKTNEMSLMSIRRDMINDLGGLVYRLNQKGANLPEELAESLRQVEALEQELDEVRSNYNAQKLKDAMQHAAEKAARAAKKTDAKTSASPGNAVPAAQRTQSAGEQTEAEAAFPQVPTLVFPAEKSCTADHVADDDLPTLEC